MRKIVFDSPLIEAAFADVCGETNRESTAPMLHIVRARGNGYLDFLLLSAFKNLPPL
jgi:hypothetical protein